MKNAIGGFNIKQEVGDVIGELKHMEAENKISKYKISVSLLWLTPRDAPS